MRMLSIDGVSNKVGCECVFGSAIWHFKSTFCLAISK